MADLVTKHFHPGLLASDLEAWSEVDVVAKVQASCRADALTAVGVSLFKRRLSGASDASLAVDKKTARVVGNALNNVVSPLPWEDLRELARWDPEVRRRAAVVIWMDWLPEVDERLDELMRFCSTWVMRVNLGSVEVRRCVRKLDQARKFIK